MKYPSQQRNLNPIPVAVFAMAHWHNEYAASGAGSMDFYDSLSERDKRFCQETIERIKESLKLHSN
jgi:hypothetical protein